MKSRAINATPCLEHFGLNQAAGVTGGERLLDVLGQTSTDGEARSLRDGDLLAQFAQASNNLKAVFTQADRPVVDTGSRSPAWHLRSGASLD